MDFPVERYSGKYTITLPADAPHFINHSNQDYIKLVILISATSSEVKIHSVGDFDPIVKFGL